jgi:hypothetical protein
MNCDAAGSATPSRLSRLSTLSVLRVRSLRHRVRSIAASDSACAGRSTGVTVSVTTRCGNRAGSAAVSGATLAAVAAKPPSATTTVAVSRRGWRPSACSASRAASRARNSNMANDMVDQSGLDLGPPGSAQACHRTLR